MADSARALLFDSDPRRWREVIPALKRDGFEVIEVSSLAAMIHRFEQLQLQLQLVFLTFTATVSTDALAAAARLRQKAPGLPIVVGVRDGTEAVAVAGVTEYLRSPDEAAMLTRVIRRCPPAAQIDGQLTDEPYDPVVGSAPGLLTACAYLDRAATTNATVLITGETGTGKELAAYRVHRMSGRKGRFVPVNAAAIPDSLLESELFGHESGAFTGATRAREGLLQIANGGTIFLDEVGDMSYAAQAKILRVIERREVVRLGGRHAMPLKVRVVAATNQDLDQAVAAGRFRKDLYFRLNVVRVHLPPLRERRCDIPSIIDHYLRTLGRASQMPVDGLSPEALDALVAYDWPGNVRELKNLIESVFVSVPAGRIGLADLPPAYQERLAQYARLPDTERARLLDALFAADWNKSRAAEMLRWSRMTLYRKMAKYSVVRSSTPGRLRDTV
jgi:DNA-binding NtrC family response regulator